MRFGQNLLLQKKRAVALLPLIGRPISLMLKALSLSSFQPILTDAVSVMAAMVLADLPKDG